MRPIASARATQRLGQIVGATAPGGFKQLDLSFECNRIQECERRNKWGRLRRPVQSRELALLLGIVVGLFEYNLRLQGGIFAATRASSFAGTVTLDFWIYFHTFFAITTIFIWAGLILFSLRRFPSPPRPGDFSATHKRWGRIGMIWMLTTGVTAIPVYIYGFAL